jgi:hypothetical protein
MRRLLFLAWVCCVHGVFAQPARPPAQTTDRGEVEVQVVGCVSGDTLTETTLNRTEGQSNSSESLNPKGRWRLSVSKEQREPLRELSPHPIEIFGTVRESELARGRVVKSVRVGKAGRAWVGTSTSKNGPDVEAIALPLLRVGSFKRLEGACR